MPKIMSALTVAAVAGTLTVFTAAPASALTGTERLGCYVTPSTTQPRPVADDCAKKTTATSYGVKFQVLYASGTYSYAWSVPPEHQSHISNGCTSTTDFCILTNLAPGQIVSVSVTISQNGQSATLTARADLACSYPCVVQ